MIKLLYELSGNISYAVFASIIIYSCMVFDIFNLTRYKKNQLNFVATILAFAIGFVAGALGFTVAGSLAVGIAIFSVIGAALIYGGIALSITQKSNADFTVSSPTYSAIKQTQTNPDLPLPMLYGTVKLAGNRIWQDDNATTTVKRIVAFAEGEITDFTDIRLNDIPITEISGITVHKYYGTPTQEVDSIIPGATHADRCEVVGSLRNVAYLAITVPTTSDIQGNYNLTTVVKGRKIRVCTDEDTYTTEYSENPAWVLLDFLTAYNGLGLGLNNNGTKNDAAIKTIFDLDTFIESADFCDEIVTSTLTGTVATSGTTVTGTGTAFETEIITGETISIGNQDRIVTAITDDTHLTVNTAFTTMTGQTATEKQPRFAFNMIFDSQTSARSLIDEIQRNCRGGLFTKNGKFQFKIDKAEAISQVFTADDIIKGSEVFHTIPSEEHYDILKCVYISPGHEWQKVEAFAEIPEYRDGVPIEHSVNMYSCTSFKQASRLSWYYVNSKTLCPYFGEFKTDYRAYDREVGDVIQHYSLLMGATFTSKITSITNDGAGVFTVTWRNYDENLYSDTLGSKQPKVLISNLSDVYAYPADVSSFSAVQNQKLIEFTWTSILGANITYEIRKGVSWANSSLVATNLTGTSYTTNLAQKGTLTYWIKAKNKYNYSKNATSDLLNVQYIPELNEIVIQNILENASGTHTNTYIYNNILKPIPNTLWQDSSPESWSDNGNRYYADNIGNWGSSTLASSNGAEITLTDENGDSLTDENNNNLTGLDNVVSIYYVSEIYDISANLSNIVSFNKNEYLTDSQQSIIYEWHFSEDGETYSDWMLCNTGTYQFRYYQTRITMINPNGNQMNVSNFIASVDVPDRIEIYTNREITNSSAGLTITYATDMESKIASSFIKEEPAVIPASKTNSSYAVVTSSLSESCTIKLYTNDGVLTTGSVNVYVSGY